MIQIMKSDDEIYLKYSKTLFLVCFYLFLYYHNPYNLIIIKTEKTYTILRFEVFFRWVMVK